MTKVTKMTPEMEVALPYKLLTLPTWLKHCFHCIQCLHSCIYANIHFCVVLNALKSASKILHTMGFRSFVL